MKIFKLLLLALLFFSLVGCDRGDIQKDTASSVGKKNHSSISPSIEKNIGANILICTVSASSLSKHRKNLGLDINSTIDRLSEKASQLINVALVWNQNESNIWQPGVRKSYPDYKYAGKVDGIYQTVRQDDDECRGDSLLSKCDLRESIVDGIGMDVSHYLAKWPIFFLAMEQSSQNEEDSEYYKKVIAGTVKQLEDRVIEYEDDHYLLTNYMDGTNGVYRWNYSHRGKNWGYNSYELSHSYLFSIIGYLDRTSGNLFDLYTHTLNNMNNYSRIAPSSSPELLVRLSLKNHEETPILECLDIQQYQGCEERYIFETKIKPELERSFTGENADKTASYYYIVGQHHTVMQYAFKHNIQEWKEEYYRHFARFVKEVVDSDYEWVNLNKYYESHYILWASIFLQLSSEHDKEDYSHYATYNKNIEEKLRIFLESYVDKLSKSL